MRTLLFKTLIFLGTVLPYPFLAMYADARLGSIALYLLMFLILGSLSWLSHVLRCRYISVAASLTSGFLSWLWANAVLQNSWGWYFKPFRVDSLSILISVLGLGWQMMIWWCLSRKQNRQQGTL